MLSEHVMTGYLDQTLLAKTRLWFHRDIHRYPQSKRSEL